MRALKILGAMWDGLAGFLTRYVPDVEPIVFDADASARWARMVETADRLA